MLIPEVPFTLKGDHGLFKYLEGVLEKKGHCVVCIAEGAGQVRAGLEDRYLTWLSMPAQAQVVFSFSRAPGRPCSPHIQQTWPCASSS